MTEHTVLCPKQGCISKQFDDQTDNGVGQRIFEGGEGLEKKKHILIPSSFALLDK